MSRQGTLRVGGVTPLTTLDWPDHLSAVLFCQGCGWRCRYCHNPELIAARSNTETPWSDILAFLDRRRSLLDGVVFSGGDPLFQHTLPGAIQEVRAMGLGVALHTAGGLPRQLARVLPQLDWVGLDIKAERDDYPLITGIRNAGDAAWHSLRLLLDSGVPFEVRTTVHWSITSTTTLQRLAHRLRAMGVEDYAIQIARSTRMLDPSLGGHLTPAAADTLWETFAHLFPRFSLRAAA